MPKVPSSKAGVRPRVTSSTATLTSSPLVVRRASTATVMEGTSPTFVTKRTSYVFNPLVTPTSPTVGSASNAVATRSRLAPAGMGDVVAPWKLRAKAPTRASVGNSILWISCTASWESHSTL